MKGRQRYWYLTLGNMMVRCLVTCLVRCWTNRYPSLNPFKQRTSLRFLRILVRFLGNLEKDLRLQTEVDEQFS